MSAVSVIIPTHNRRAMVREAAALVIAQREIDFEVELLIVDDGSTDGTADGLSDAMAALAIARGESDKISSRVVVTARRGVAAARNTGASLARGEFIAFLDSDDLWTPYKLARQLAFMRAHPELEISQSNEIWFRNGRRVNPGRRHRKRGGDFFADSLDTCLVSPSAVIVRSGFFRTCGGFDESMTACEDYDLWLRMMAAGAEIGLLDEPLAIRRAGHAGQLSATVAALDRFRVVSMLNLLCDFDLEPARRAAVLGALAGKCSILAQGFARRGNFTVAALVEEIGHRARGALNDQKSPDFAALLEKARTVLLKPARNSVDINDSVGADA